MSMDVGRRTVIIGMAALALAPPSVGRADGHSIQMLNRHPDDPRQRNVFLPLITTLEPGQSVAFVATDKGHNTESIQGMIPDGVEPWKGRINAEVELTLERPGVYGYKCTPHYGLGMVGLLIVRGPGMADNLEAAKAVRQRGRARQVFDEIWAQVEAENLLA